MLTPRYLGEVGNYLEKVYYDLETDILCDIAGWLKDNNLEASSTAEYEYWLMKALGVNQQAMNEHIAKVLQITDEQVERIMNDSTYESMRKDINVCRNAGIIDAGFSFDVSNTVKKHKAGLKNELNNLCDSTAKFANNKMMQIFDKAYLGVSSGLMSYDQAVEQACKDLYKDGIKVVNYQSGHVNHVDTAVRVAVRTGVNQNALACAEELLDELDVNLVETSSHAGARPSHEEWQGKVFWRKHPEGNYRNFYEATGYGTGAGLGGWNCRHNFWPYFPEVGRTSHDDIPKAENDRVYQLEQEQRYQERTIRSWERRRRIKSAAGEDVTIEKIKLRDWRKKHEQFLKENSDVLKPWQARTKVYGGNKLPKKTPNNTKPKKADTMKIEKVISKPVIEEKIEYKEATSQDYSKLRKQCQKKVSKEDELQIFRHELPERRSGGGYVATTNYSIINSNMRGDGFASMSLIDDDYKTIKTLQKAIRAFQVDDNYTFTRYVNGDYITSVFGVKAEVSSGRGIEHETVTNSLTQMANRSIVEHTVPKITEDLQAFIGTDISEKSFLSTSIVSNKNIMQDKVVKFNVHVKEGTHCYIPKNRKESECIFMNGTVLHIEDVNYDKTLKKWVFDVLVKEGE